MRILIVCCVFFVLTITDCLALPCRSTSDCACGDICVSRSKHVPCPEGELCSCKTGCALADVYLNIRRISINVYCNRCRCPKDSVAAKGIPLCTSRPWCNLPANITLYSENTNCPSV